jgi:hypothetical protein
MQRVSADVRVCFVTTTCTKEFRKHLKEKAAQNQASDDTDGNPCSLLDSAEVSLTGRFGRNRRPAWWRKQAIRCTAIGIRSP